MIRRPGAIAFARAIHALFFLALSVYGFLAYTPFAYDAFIKPGVSHALWFFIVIAPALFWVVLLLTGLTLMPQLTTRGARGRVFALTYMAAGLLAGAAVAKQPLSGIGNTPLAFGLGIVSLLWPIGLAIVDHRVWGAPKLHSADPVRLLRAALAAAGLVCATFALGVPFRAAQTIGIDLPARSLATGVAASLVMHAFLFVAVFLAVMTVIGIAQAARLGAAAEYWLLMAPFVVCATLIFDRVVWLSLGFLGPGAMACSAALALAIAAAWADLARLRSQAAIDSIDPVALFGAPVAGVRSRRTAIVLLAAVPVVSNLLVRLVAELDWNFTFQKLIVLTTWIAAGSAVYAALGARRARSVSQVWLIGVPVAVFVAYQLVGRIDPALSIDRYAAVDPSMRLMRDARTAQSADTAARYAFFRSQTLVLPSAVHPPAVDFVAPLTPTAARKPHIFLIVIDSLRRDYLTPYNPRVTFTPEIARLAADSLVFEHAWTRYAGTLLAVPSIWAGGMVPHVVRQTQFAGRNTLLKLLDGNGYRRMMDMDSVVETFDLRDRRLIELNPGHEIWAATDFCTSVDAFQRQLPRDRTQPTFFYSLPQNMHPTVALQRAVPAGEQYPGFEARAASSLHRVDACFGRFMEVLKQEHLYDDSIIIVTSDHGDLLGEEGRWGHSFWLYPEVMQIPLIVHVPAWLRGTYRTDLDARVFSTDLAPSLYTLLGYQPADLGPLFGRSFFTPRDADSSSRRRETSLLASSYGAVYGVLSQNGRRLYVVDTVDATEYAMDLTHAQQRVTVTPGMMSENRREIEDRLRSLAAYYHYDR